MPIKKITVLFLLKIFICYSYFSFAMNFAMNNEKKVLDKKIEEYAGSWSPSISETIDLISKKSYYPIKVEDAITKALNSFVQHDKNARFLNPKEYNQLLKTTKGEFYGIGIILAPKKENDPYILITDVIPESPAYKKGLRAQDKIISIDGESVENLTTEQIINKIKADKRFSQIKISILRNSQIQTFLIERDVVKENNVQSYYFPKQQIIYCGITLFSHGVFKQFKNIIEKINEIKARGFILDLRNNGGGVLRSAVKCASLFLDKGTLIVSTKGKNGKIADNYSTDKNPILKSKIPIIILIDNLTASAAEILAGTLKYYSSTGKNSCNPYIFLLGTETHGKGSIQELIPVSNNCGLKITTAIFSLPNGQLIDEIGIKPDFNIERKYQLNKKLLEQEKNLENKNQSIQQTKKDNEDPILKLLKQDNQITACITIINLINFGLKSNPSIINSHTNTLKFIKQMFATESELKPKLLN